MTGGALGTPPIMAGSGAAAHLARPAVALVLRMRPPQLWVEVRRWGGHKGRGGERLQLGGDLLLCKPVRPHARHRRKRTRRHVAIDCRRRDPPRLRRRNLLLLLRLWLRPAVSHAGALVRRVLLPASAAASAA